MFEFLRPEVRATLKRWREALVGGALALLGLYWGLVGGGLLRIVAVALILLGAALLFAGIQRGRLRTGSGGAGVVQLVEGQLGYFGPQTGGVIAVADISAVSRRGNLWILQGAGQRLEVPMDASGAECLLDAFAMLPGLNMSAILARTEDHGDIAQVLWQRGPRRLG